MTTELKASAAALMAQHSAALDYLTQKAPQLRASQMRFFLAVAENPGSSMSDLAKELDMTIASVSRNCHIFGVKGRKRQDHKGEASVRKGPALGWVRAIEDEDNASRAVVFLSKEGQDVLDQYMRILHGDV